MKRQYFTALFYYTLPLYHLIISYHFITLSPYHFIVLSLLFFFSFHFIDKLKIKSYICLLFDNNKNFTYFSYCGVLDNLDRQILEIISQNARIPFKDVAAECGVSRAAIHQRVQRLIDLGVIVGSGYHVNPKSLGYRTCTYVGIKLEKGSMYKAVVAEMQKIPEIVECHFTTGPYTMLTKVYARDNEHLMDLLNNKMQEIPGVTATETLISLEQSIKKEFLFVRKSKINKVKVIRWQSDNHNTRYHLITFNLLIP